MNLLQPWNPIQRQSIPSDEIIVVIDHNTKLFERVTAHIYAEGISRSTITRYVGAKDSLESERTFALFTLPRGVACGLIDGLFRLDPAGFLRAGAIITGLAITTIGYLLGSISQYAVIHKDMRQ